ncbi:MAG: hypothetical protein IJ805_03350 [Lachnospiraceae bacterium]|nr:hypothetical protein [Lachnospiraceae bacterium]
MNYILWLLICIAEGVLFAAVFVAASKRDKRLRIPVMGVFIVLEIVSVYFLYRGYETVWHFFVHPYLSLMIVNIADLIFLKRDRFEKLFLWPFYVLPAMSGFILVWGWIFKIRALNELIKAI